MALMGEIERIGRNLSPSSLICRDNTVTCMEKSDFLLMSLLTHPPAQPSCQVAGRQMSAQVR